MYDLEDLMMYIKPPQSKSSAPQVGPFDSLNRPYTDEEVHLDLLAVFILASKYVWPPQ